MDESKRIKRLRGDVIKAIPKSPNNRETKEKLDGMPLATLLIHYLNWIIRYVSVKPRKTIIEPTVTADLRWRLLRGQVNALLDKVRSGENLTPHLSIQPHSKGYSPETSKTGPDVDRWADKDFLLNVMGFHHFHLGEKIEVAGHVERTDDVLFARVSRGDFTAIGIFNHSVFEPTGDEMSAERKRLWKVFDEHTGRGVPPGSVVIPLKNGDRFIFRGKGRHRLRAETEIKESEPLISANEAALVVTAEPGAIVPHPALG